KDLALFRGNGRIPLDKLGHYPAEGFNPKRKRCNVEKQHVMYVAGKDPALNRSADRHDLVRVYPFMRVFGEDLLYQFLHCGDPGRTADENYLVDIACGHTC